MKKSVTHWKALHNRHYTAQLHGPTESWIPKFFKQGAKKREQWTSKVEKR